MKISFNCTDDQQVVHTHKDAGLSDQVPCSKPDISPEAYLNDYRNRMPFHYIEEGSDGYYYWQYGSIMDLVVNFVDEIAQSEDMPEAVLDVRINDKSVVDPVAGIAHLGSMAARSAVDYYTLQQTDKIVSTLSKQIKDLQDGNMDAFVKDPDSLMKGQLLMWDPETRSFVGSPLVQGNAEKSIILKTSSSDPNFASHEGAVLFGRGLRSSFPYQVIVGHYNQLDPDAIFAVGSGFSKLAPLTAFSVSRDGHVIVSSSPNSENGVVRLKELSSLRTDLTSILNQKLDRREEVSEYPQAYVKLSNGTQAMYSISYGPEAGAVALRDDSGNLQTNSPRYAKDSANKEYVDSKFKSDAIFDKNLTVKGNLTVADAFEVLPDGRAKVQSAPVDNDDVVRKKELDTKLNIIPNSIFDITLYGYQNKQANGFNLTHDSVSYSIPYRNASGKFLVGNLTDSDSGNTVVNKNALDKKLDKTGGTITGSLIIAQNLVVSGTTSTVDTQNLKVADKLIYVAKDNTVPLTSPAGLITPKYDGTNSGGIVYDSTGTAYVGDITLDSSGNVDVDNSDLQPIATRSAAITNDHLVKWDDTNKKLVDSGKSIDNLVQKINTLNSIAYGKSGGNELYWIISSYADTSTLAYRLDKGRLKVGTPTENNDATTKLYVDNLIDKKLDKSSSANIVYGTDSDKNQIEVPYAEFGDSGSIVQRNSAGNVYTGTPTEDWESTPKNYTDSSIKKAEKSLIVMEHIVGTLDSKTGKYKYVNKSLYLPIAFYDNTSGVQILLQVTATADGYIATSDNEFNVWAMCWNDKYGGQDFTEGSSDPNDWSYGMKFSTGYNSAFRQQMDNRNWTKFY